MESVRQKLEVVRHLDFRVGKCPTVNLEGLESGRQSLEEGC